MASNDANNDTTGSRDHTEYLHLGRADKARRIAYRRTPAQTQEAPGHGEIGLVWLAGLRSDMTSTKAGELALWGPAHGFHLTRFDYPGHGQSDIAFEKAVISDWIEEAEAVLTRLTSGPQILIGSSTGGHVALALLRRLIRGTPDEAARIRGLVLIAPAWDLTEELMWNKFPEEARRAILENGVYHMPNDYDEPYAITRTFIEDGRNDLIKPDPFNPGRPVHVLQGALDEAVPIDHARELMTLLPGDHVTMTEVADGEHRMSRPQDLHLLWQAITAIATGRHTEM